MFGYGILTGVVISALCFTTGIKLWKYLKKKYVDPRWYKIAKFSTSANEDGTFNIDFYLDHETICRGYTKKAPPANARPEDLEGMIRSHHSGRGRYRIFWRLKKTCSK